MVAGTAHADTASTIYAIPLQRPSLASADDAYSAWFNAQQRCSSALRAWWAAPRAARADAHRTYVVDLAIEEMAAADLQRLQRPPRRLGHDERSDLSPSCGRLCGAARA